MKPAEIETRVRQIAWAAPGAGLRARVLASALVTSRAVSWSDRVWFSRTWRLAAVAVVLLLATLEQVPGSARSSAAVESQQAVADESFVEEAARQAGLSPEQAAALAYWAAAVEKNTHSGPGFGGIALEDLDSGGETR